VITGKYTALSQETEQSKEPVVPASNVLLLPGAYHAYLVRLWQERPQAPWRASVQSVTTGETVRFADLGQLFAFLQAQAAPNAPAADAPTLPMDDPG
jgi:hypothetical protein